jgi:hypothetical protein
MQSGAQLPLTLTLSREEREQIWHVCDYSLNSASTSPLCLTRQMARTILAP